MSRVYGIGCNWTFHSLKSFFHIFYGGSLPDMLQLYSKVKRRKIWCSKQIVHWGEYSGRVGNLGQYQDKPRPEC